VALDDNSIQVLDSANLGGAGAVVNTLPSAAVAERLVVSPADGSLYALTPSSSEVVVWDNTINTAGADLTAANLGTVTVGNGAADMVIVPNGSRVIVANSADSSLSVIDPADLASGATTQALSLAPSALAIASTTSEVRLYVADSATPRVQILDAASFAAISAAEALSSAPIALAVSPGGRWLYATVDVAGEGELWVIDTHALEAGDVVIGGNVAIGDNPQQPVLALGDGVSYVPFAGDPAVETSGGVALVTVTESACDALFEATLDGCPACGCEDDSCLVLATVTEYVFDADVTDDDIDNLRDRTLLPSTQVLYEVLLCLLNREAPTGGSGEQGPPGQPGQGITSVDVTFVDCTDPGSFSFDPATGALTLEIPRGCDGVDGINGTNGTNGTNGAPGAPGQNGTNGQDGQGVDQVVVNFIPCDQQGSSSFVDGILTINLPSGCGDDNPVKYGHICAINWNHNKETSRNQLGRGLIVAFDVPVRNGDIHRHTFRVEVGLPQDNQFGAICWCELRPEIITGIRLPQDCEITEDFEFMQGDDEAQVNGAIFVPGNMQPGFTYRVYVEGDHIRTFNFDTGDWGTALDANFLRGELPTGDDVEGGQFYSWFDLSRGN
jgi:DNA-binding beta-propeller fold protein YncE